MPNLSTYLIIITKKCHLEYGRQKNQNKKTKQKKTLKQTNKQNKRQKQAIMFVVIAQNGNFK